MALNAKLRTPVSSVEEVSREPQQGLEQGFA